MHFKKDSFNILIIVSFVLLLTLPFINKAFNIDDTEFIYISRHLIKDPLHPYSFEWLPSVPATHVTDPPLVFYYNAAVILLFGETEKMLHFFYIIFPLIAGIAMYFLSKKFTKRPLFSTLFLITSVVFVVMSSTLMLDIPFLAFFLLSIAFFVYGVDSGNKTKLILGVIFCGFAYLTKYAGIIVFPVLASYAILRKKPKYILYLTIPAILGLLWNLYTYMVYGVPHNFQILPWLLGSQKSFSSQAIMVKLITNMTYIGGATIFPLMLLYPFLRERINKLAYLLIVAFSLIAAIALYYTSANFSYRYSIAQLILFAFFFSTGIFVFYFLARHNLEIIAELFKQKKIWNIFNERYANNIFLFSWIITAFLFNTFFAGGAARYANNLIPPIAVFYFNIIDNHRFSNKNNLKSFIILSAALSIALSILVASADYEFAKVYKDFASTVDKYQTDGNAVWFAGHSGFQYYMENKGYKMLDVDVNRLKKGDIVIKSQIQSPSAFPPILNGRLNLIDAISYNSALPLKIHNPEAHAGFYTFGGGFLPYSVSDANLENFSVFRVIK